MNTGGGMAGRTTNVQTTHGAMAVSVVRPDAPRGSGMILYMDAFGLRPALEAMATRIAS